jgi:hypothetical protein
LDWWTEAAATGAVVDARRSQSARSEWAPKTRKIVPERNVVGEFMSLDLIHTNFPAYSGAPSYWSNKYWTTVLEKKRQVFLALESEWNVDLHHVLHDASKLALIRASTKVMVFGTWDGSARAEYMDALRGLRSTLADPAPWLCVDVPSVAVPGGKWTPGLEVF